MLNPLAFSSPSSSPSHSEHRAHEGGVGGDGSAASRRNLRRGGPLSGGGTGDIEEGAGHLMAAEHVPRHHVVAVSSSDMTITLWSDTIYEFVGTMPPSPAQTCMRYLPPHQGQR